MGGEFGQTTEWNHDQSLSWHLLDYDLHKGILQLISDLNALYKSEPALYQFSFSDLGFEWVDYSDRENSVMVFMRKGEESKDALVVVCNFTPEVRTQYRIGVPVRGTWKEVFNSDNLRYGGSGQLNIGLVHTPPVKYHGKDYSLVVTLPPLGVSIFKLNEEQTAFELE